MASLTAGGFGQEEAALSKYLIFTAVPHSCFSVNLYYFLQTAPCLITYKKRIFIVNTRELRSIICGSANE
jgi:hypothetical protein